MARAVTRHLKWWAAVCALGLTGACDGPMDPNDTIEVDQEALSVGAIPARIKVMPVFLVPSGQSAPQTSEKNLLAYHLAWAQTRYREMLHNRDTFLTTGVPAVVTDSHDAAWWTNAPDGALEQVMLQNFSKNRFDNPYIYVVVIMGTGGATSAGPMNGGVNTGGGVVRISNWTTVKNTLLQSTLQHELVHAFGVSHSFHSEYTPTDPICNSNPRFWSTPCSPYPTPLICRFSQAQGWSVSSYDECHWTNDVNPSKTPGILLPEEIAVMSLNKRVFPNLYFDPETDLLPATTGVYRMADNPMPASIAGQTEAILTVTTSSGETFGSSVANIARNAIRRSPAKAVSIRKSNPTVGWDPNSMWHSNPSSNGWVSVQVDFPMTVSLNAIGVHTEHSGAAWGADSVRISANAGSPPFNFVAQQDALAIDEVVPFTTTSGRSWKFEFHSRSGNGGYVVVRGLQFFGPDGEIFSSFLPTEQVNYPQVTTSSGETYGSKVSHAVTGWSTPPNNAQTGYQPALMWHSGYNSTGWVSLQVIFPYPVTVNGLEVHSQYGGQAHLASKVEVNYDNNGTWTYLTRQNTGADATLPFSQVKARRFLLNFYSTSGYVVLRQLRFQSPVSNGYLERPDCITGPQVLPPY